MSTTVQPTSAEVYRHGHPFRTKRVQVLIALKHFQKEGVNPCNKEIQEYLGWEINQVTGRINELRNKKYGCKIIFAGKKDYNGKKVMSWRLNPEALTKVVVLSSDPTTLYIQGQTPQVLCSTLSLCQGPNGPDNLNSKNENRGDLNAIR